VLCQIQPLLPVGLTDLPYEKSVKLYCGRCEDIYSPKSSRHGSIDGAYFGTTFPHLLFLVYPSLIPPKSGASDLVPSISTAAVGAVNFSGPASGNTNAASSSSKGGGGGDGEAGAAGRRSRKVREEPDVGETSAQDGVNTWSAALKAERYRPKIYGFQLHEIAKLQRWQEAVRDRYVVFLSNKVFFSFFFSITLNASDRIQASAAT
jgi:casein kinase II subunit beta